MGTIVVTQSVSGITINVNGVPTGADVTITVKQNGTTVAGPFHVTADSNGHASVTVTLPPGTYQLDAADWGRSMISTDFTVV